MALIRMEIAVLEVKEGFEEGSYTPSEIAVLEAQFMAVCGEAARLVGGGKTPASQVSYGCALYLDTYRFFYVSMSLSCNCLTGRFIRPCAGGVPRGGGADQGSPQAGAGSPGGSRSRSWWGRPPPRPLTSPTPGAASP